MRAIVASSALAGLMLLGAARAEAPAATVPELFKVKFETTAGSFTIEAHRDWAPIGADRFYRLVEEKYFDDCRFFRNIKGFMVQFGINGDPKVNQRWYNDSIKDDPVKQSNQRGMVTFAMRGPNTRTTQLFINFSDNSRLDKDGFAPIGKVVAGMAVVERLFAGYGEGAPAGKGPDQTRIQTEGNDYLKKEFPRLDYIKAARIVP